jgi:hypothetical protein
MATKPTLEQAIAARKKLEAQIEEAAKVEHEIRVTESKANLIATLDTVIEYCVPVNSKEYGKDFVRDAKSRVSKIVKALWGDDYKATKTATKATNTPKIPVVMEDIVTALKARERTSKASSVGKKELESIMANYYNEDENTDEEYSFDCKFDHNKWAKADKSKLKSHGEKIKKVFWA